MRIPYRISFFFIAFLILMSSSIYAKHVNRDYSDTHEFKPHVVVAILDSGINVYHEIFRRWNETKHPSRYIEGFPKNIKAINLTFGKDWQLNYEKDKEIWKKLQRGKLYWFPNTNIMGISFGQSTWYGREELGEPVLDNNGHGTSVSSVIAKINPNATILMVEVGANKLREALSWVVNQSWVDIIDIEFGIWYKPRVLFWTTIWWKGLEKITKRGVESGKIIITAAGNRPWINPWLSYISGPPWMLCIGGAESYCHGVTVLSAKGADYLSSFTQMAAFYQSTKSYWPVSGNSLSASAATGVISFIILKTRRELGYIYGIKNESLIYVPEKEIEITNWDIRYVINHTAVYWDRSDWSLYEWILRWPYRNATFPSTGEPFPWWFKLLLRKYTLSVPVNSIAPWLQMGWGFVSKDIIDESIDVLLGKRELPKKPRGAIRYMEWIYEMRKNIWKS